MLVHHSSSEMKVQQTYELPKTAEIDDSRWDIVGRLYSSTKLTRQAGSRGGFGVRSMLPWKQAS